MSSDKNSLPPISILLYVFAAATLILAVLILIAVLGFHSTADASLTVFRTALNPLVNGMIDMLIRWAQSMGTMLAVLIFTLSLLLCATGRQTAHVRDLSRRLAELEARLAAVEKISE